MSLFRIASDTPTNGTGAIHGPHKRAFGTGTPAVALADAIGELTPDQDVHYASAGAWSLHDLIRYCIDQTGPGSVILFTWSISPRATEQLIQMRTAGSVQDLALIVDGAQRKLSRQAFEEIRPHCSRVRLTQIHAKGFLLAAGDWRITCATSQNATLNPRHEIGVLSTCPRVYAFHHAWLDPLLDGGDPLDVQGASKAITAEGD